MFKFTAAYGAKVNFIFNSFKLKAMKTKHLLLFGLIVAFSSCSTAYRTVQTPDDVYYSPAPPQDNYVQTDNQQDKDSYGYNNNNTYNNEDLEIRRGIRDQRYRSNISLDFGFGYDPYNSLGYGYNPYNYNPYAYNYNPYGYNNYYSYPGVSYYPYSHNYYDSYSSPYYNYYYPPVYYIPQPGTAVTIAPRRYNLGAYNSTNTRPLYTHPTTQPSTTNSVPVRTFTPQPATRSGVGNLIRRVFTPENNNRTYSNDNSNNNSTPARTYQTNTPSSSSSSSSGSSGSAPVRTFRK